jgi:hypothetical protein
LAKNDIERNNDMRATVAELITSQPSCFHRMSGRDGARDACPDLRWRPAVRVFTLIGCSALAWATVILLSSFLFG